MSRHRGNGYAGVPALLLAVAFMMPLLAGLADWLGLPRGVRLALPLLLSVAVLAGPRGPLAGDARATRTGTSTASAATGSKGTLAGSAGDAADRREGIG